MEIFIGIILVLLLVVGWVAFWNLVKHPESFFFLEGKAPTHTKDLQEQLGKILVYFNSQETGTPEDIANLLGVPEREALLYLEMLEREKTLRSREEVDGSIYFFTP